jgi:ABC-2 type transport system ATP-binding protein
MGALFKDKPDKIKRILGLVPQEVALYDNLTAHENLAFFGKLSGLTGKQLHGRIEESLDFAGLVQQANRRISSYSGGMKRRLNLAAGLLHEPQVLFLDEPTVGIDTQSRHMIHQQLIELNRVGMTILYTTHYMEEAQELCSRIGIMDGGKIIKTGCPADLLRQNDCVNLEELFLRLTGRQLRDT